MIEDIFKEPMKEAQKLLKKEYSEKGLTDEILDAQVKLNIIGNLLDIHDETETIYGEFVQ